MPSLKIQRVEELCLKFFYYCVDYQNTLEVLPQSVNIHLAASSLPPSHLAAVRTEAVSKPVTSKFVHQNDLGVVVKSDSYRLEHKGILGL
jgi:hypothetical protein